MAGFDIVELLGIEMFCPLWARKLDTADTIPGRSGQDSVKTNWWSGMCGLMTVPG
jgi:hypothetical protein